MRRINLPVNKHKGIYIRCSKCKNDFTRTQEVTKVIKKTKEVKVLPEPCCKKTGTKFTKCPFFEKHSFKTRYHISGTQANGLYKTFETRSYNEAVIQAIEFYSECNEKLQVTRSEENNSQSKKRLYLIQSQVAHLDFLANVDVADHKQKERSDKHIKEVHKCLTLFNEALLKHKFNIRILTLDKIDDTLVGYFHTYLTEDKGYAQKTYNNKMGAVKGFMKWAIKEYKLKVENPFEEVRTKSVKKDNRTISKNNYRALLAIITPERGQQKMKNGKSRNRFFPYLKTAIELALHTGCRREELVSIKWNMIYLLDEETKFIKVDNLKVERDKGEGYNDNVAPKIITITKGLMKFLNTLGYENKKGSDEFIVFPDRGTRKKEGIMDNISKGFSHYYKQLDTGDELQFKCLRKTYLRYLNAVMEGQTKKLSAHEGDQVLEDHYIDPRIVKKAAREFEVFK